MTELGQTLVDRKTRAKYRVVEVGSGFVAVRPLEGGPRAYWSNGNIARYFMTEIEQATPTEFHHDHVTQNRPDIHRGPDGAELGGEAGGG